MFDNSCVYFLYMYWNQLWTHLNISYNNVLGFAFGIISYSRFNRAPKAEGRGGREGSREGGREGEREGEREGGIEGGRVGEKGVGEKEEGRVGGIE